MNKRIWSLIFIGIAVAVLVAGGYYIYKRVVAPPPMMNNAAPQAPNQGGGGRGGGGRALPVSVYIANYNDVSDGTTRLGSLLANETVDLASQTS